MARPNPDKMTFLEHLEELRQRLVRSALALVVGFAACWNFREEIFRFMTQPMRAAGFKDSFIYTSPADALKKEDLGKINLTGIDWVIGGGESGSGHRACELAWAQGLRDKCESAGTAFFWKQWGGFTPKAGGRMLDGIEHSGYPRELQLA